MHHISRTIILMWLTHSTLHQKNVHFLKMVSCTKMLGATLKKLPQTSQRKQINPARAIMSLLKLEYHLLLKGSHVPKSKLFQRTWLTFQNQLAFSKVYNFIELTLGTGRCLFNELGLLILFDNEKVALQLFPIELFVFCISLRGSSILSISIYKAQTHFTY